MERAGSGAHIETGASVDHTPGPVRIRTGRRRTGDGPFAVVVVVVVVVSLIVDNGDDVDKRASRFGLLSAPRCFWHRGIHVP